MAKKSIATLIRDERDGMAERGIDFHGAFWLINNQMTNDPVQDDGVRPRIVDALELAREATILEAAQVLGIDPAPLRAKMDKVRKQVSVGTLDDDIYNVI